MRAEQPRDLIKKQTSASEKIKYVKMTISTVLTFFFEKKKEIKSNL